MNEIPALIRVFAYLSLLTVGGGMAAFPELKILTVEVHHWLTFPQLVHFYSVGQMAPGPNMMMIVSIGTWAAGIIPLELGALLQVLRVKGHHLNYLKAGSDTEMMCVFPSLQCASCGEQLHGDSGLTIQV